ncbi:MAG: phosphate-starvation-inducible PsiE family protein [Actinomycetota bacterium]|nr:phosphate-starvation-inducible PsiE family protein [Actinomycetota bacterium]
MTEARSKDRLVHNSLKGMRMAENAVYTVLGLLLFVGALAVLVTLGYHMVLDIDKGVEKSITTTLDGLLLVFILLELLAAVRATMIERKLVAEPFLVVGIIASIKEIVVVSLEAKDDNGEAFDNAMTEIGVLAGVVLLLALASYLVRRKEREPEEDDEDEPEQASSG